MDLKVLMRISDQHLIQEKATLLGHAKPPLIPGVYALFFEGERVYVGVARGKKGLRNRKRNYVGGDSRHTTHRQFLKQFPDKTVRTTFIKENVAMAWYETQSAEIAEELEIELINLLNPKWNGLGKVS